MISPPLLSTSLLGAVLVLVAAFSPLPAAITVNELPVEPDDAVVNSIRDEHAVIPLNELPDDCVVGIGKRLRFSSDLLNLYLSCQALRRVLTDRLERCRAARRQFHRMVHYLSREGRYDGAWIKFFELDLDHLLFPDLLSAIPTRLIAFIQQSTKKFANVQHGPIVEAIRAKYPPSLRDVFPHCRDVASSIRQEYPDKWDLLKPTILKALFSYGITFRDEDIDHFCRMTRCWPRINRALIRKDCWGPTYLLDDLIKQGLGHQVPALIQIEGYRLAVGQANLFGAVAGIMKSIPEDVFGRILDLPEFPSLLGGRDRNGYTLLHHAFSNGRISDLAPMLIRHSNFNMATIMNSSISVVGSVRMDVNAILAYCRLRQCPQFDAYFRSTLGKLAGVLEFQIGFGREKVFESLVEDSDLADLLLLQHRGRSLMHTVISKKKFNLLPFFLKVPGCDFRVLDPYGRSPVKYLRRRDLAAFIEHLPEPKSESLSKFHILDFVSVLTKSLSVRYLPTVEDACRILQDLVEVDFTDPSSERIWISRYWTVRRFLQSVKRELQP